MLASHCLFGGKLWVVSQMRMMSMFAAGIKKEECSQTHPTTRNIQGVALLILGYAFAWVGHFFHEMNKPASFVYVSWCGFRDASYRAFLRSIPLCSFCLCTANLFAHVRLLHAGPRALRRRAFGTAKVVPGADLHSLQCASLSRL